MNFEDLVKRSKDERKPLHEVILEEEYEELGVPVELTRKESAKILRAIIREGAKNFGKKQKTLTGMTGMNAWKMKNYKQKLISEFNRIAMISALSFAESNAAMGRIVACPTAGACGVMSGIVYALWNKDKNFDKLLDSFIVAGGIGDVISKKATLAGAEGGCQAEIGSGAAMAATMLTYYYTGDGEKCAHAAAIALKSLMGLVCDPVGGFVEVPCVKRNATAVNIAIASAEMAMAGIESIIPFDEVVEAMGKVGRALPESLRETGKGGIAATPTAKRILKELNFRSEQ